MDLPHFEDIYFLASTGKNIEIFSHIHFELLNIHITEIIRKLLSSFWIISQTAQLDLWDNFPNCPNLRNNIPNLRIKFEI